MQVFMMFLSFLLIAFIMGFSLVGKLFSALSNSAAGDSKTGFDQSTEFTKDRSFIYLFLMYAVSYSFSLIYFPTITGFSFETKVFWFVTMYAAICACGTVEGFLKVLFLSEAGIAVNIVIILVMAANPNVYSGVSTLITMVVIGLICKFSVLKKYSAVASFPRPKEIIKTFSSKARSEVSENKKRPNTSHTCPNIPGVNISEKRANSAAKAVEYKELYGWKKGPVGEILRFIIVLTMTIPFICIFAKIQIPRLDKFSDLKNWWSNLESKSVTEKENAIKALMGRFVHVSGEKTGPLSFLKVFNSPEQAFAYFTTICFGVLLCLSLTIWHVLSKGIKF